MSPPRWVEQLLLVCVPSGLTRDSVVGDMEEEFGLRAVRETPAAARRWYRRQAVGIAWRYLTRRLVPWRDAAEAPGRASSSIQGSGSGGGGMLRDLQLGLRMLRRRRGFALVAVLTLGLGIGATAAVFSLIHGVLLTPPPYERPEELVLIPAERTDGREDLRRREWAATQWLAWQQEAESFDAIAAYMWTFNFLILPDGSQSVEGLRVTQDYFQALGLEPALGRGFSEAELQAASPTAILLGHELWQQTFDGDPDIVGKTVRISRWNTTPTVVGVMPPGIRFLPSPFDAQELNYNIDAMVDFWVPTSLPSDLLDMPAWDVIGRLRSGTPARRAQEELAVIARRQAELNPDFQGMVPAVRSLTRVDLSRLCEALHSRDNFTWATRSISNLADLRLPAHTRPLDLTSL